MKLTVAETFITSNLLLGHVHFPMLFFSQFIDVISWHTFSHVSWVYAPHLPVVCTKTEKPVQCLKITFGLQLMLNFRARQFNFLLSWTLFARPLLCSSQKLKSATFIKTIYMWRKHFWVWNLLRSRHAVFCWESRTTCDRV